MKLNYEKEPFEIEEKRFYIPGALIEENVCPSCKTTALDVDLGDRYLSYPKANAVNAVHLYCDNCGTEWDVKVRLEINLTLET